MKWVVRLLKSCHYFPLQNTFQVLMTHWDILVLNFQRVVKSKNLVLGFYTSGFIALQKLFPMDQRSFNCKENLILRI